MLALCLIALILFRYTCNMCWHLFWGHCRADSKVEQISFSGWMMLFSPSHYEDGNFKYTRHRVTHKRWKGNNTIPLRVCPWFPQAKCWVGDTHSELMNYSVAKFHFCKKLGLEVIIISTVFRVNKHCCFCLPAPLYILGLEEDEYISYNMK